MTSLFLHVFPPLVAWAIRWYPGDPHHWNGPGQCEDDTATVRELILVPGIPYDPMMSPSSALFCSSRRCKHGHPLHMEHAGMRYGPWLIMPKYS